MNENGFVSRKRTLVHAKAAKEAKGSTNKHESLILRKDTKAPSISEHGCGAAAPPEPSTVSIIYPNIVKKHNGIVNFDIKIGEGTTFTIRLPYPAKHSETSPVLVVSSQKLTCK